MIYLVNLKYYMGCKKKRKLDKIKAMLLIAKSQSLSNRKHKRNERKIYFCQLCKAYQLLKIYSEVRC